MKSIELVLSIVSLLGCGLLWQQNTSLRSDLSELKESIEALESNQSSSTTNRKEKSTSSEGERPFKERGQRFSRTRGAETSAEEIDAKYEASVERVRQSVQAFSEENSIDGETSEELVVIILSNLEQQHTIRKSMKSGELDRNSGREQISALRDSQYEKMSDLLEEEEVNALKEALRGARVPLPKSR